MNNIKSKMKKLNIDSEEIMEQIEKRLHESPDGKLFPEEILKPLPHEIAMDFQIFAFDLSQ